MRVAVVQLMSHWKHRLMREGCEGFLEKLLVNARSLQEEEGWYGHSACCRARGSDA